MQKKLMINKLKLLVLGTIFGGVLGYFIAWVHIAGWFSTKWELISPPPEQPIQLLASNGSQLWVESNTGNIYFNNSAPSCTSNCWAQVESVPDHFEQDLAVVKVKKKACANPLPLFGGENRLEECLSYMWTDESYVYVLRKNGDIFSWQSTIYGEWIVLEYLQCICGGSLLVFLIALLGIGFHSIIKNRIQENNNNPEKHNLDSVG
jgi:hypothetical protein